MTAQEIAKRLRGALEHAGAPDVVTVVGTTTIAVECSAWGLEFRIRYSTRVITIVTTTRSTPDEAVALIEHIAVQP